MTAADCQTSLFADTLFFAPVFDGWALPRNPLVAYDGPALHAVPLIVGSTRNEGTIYLADEGDLGLEKYQSFLQSRFAGHSGDAWTLFPAHASGEVGPAIDRLITVAANAEPSRLMARSMEKRKSKAWLYQFTRRPRTPLANRLGVHHGVELAYVFGNMTSAAGYDETDRALSGKMMGYWVNFAKTGDPNGQGLAQWPRYHKDSDRHMAFGDALQPGRFLLRRECDFIDQWQQDRPQ